MAIRTIAPHERGTLLALVDEALRRPGAATGPADDFPLALGPDNHSGQWVLEEGGQIRAALTCLVRSFVTSVGEVPVAAIGSVVTAPRHRGRGLSRELQQELLARLKDDGVPLAVLWSDRPELYAQRGFCAAGIEYHIALEPWQAELAPPETRLRPYAPADADAVTDLYARHPYTTRRRQGESCGLYAMPGTCGWVLEAAPGAGVSAYAFLGKGQDFPGWVLEWGGEPSHVLPLVAHLRATAGARWLLAPQGAEPLAARFASAGATVWASPSGLWCVTRPDLLAARVGEADGVANAQRWLGMVDAAHGALPGVMQLAVWGFDSV